MNGRILALALALAVAVAVAGGAATVASASSRHGEHDHDRFGHPERSAREAGAESKGHGRDDDDDEDRDRDRDRDRGRGRGEGQGQGQGHDSGRERLGSRAVPPIDAAYAKECGSCHQAYPPRMLPAESWRKLMAGLDRHFGQDAELEPEVRAGVEGWLVEHAGRPPRRGDPAPLRITERRGFQGEHRKAARAAAANPSIKSLANCAACHPGAERWDFDEDRVNIPRG